MKLSVRSISTCIAAVGSSIQKETNMTSLVKKNWLMTPPPEIFDMIMMMVGLSSLESLHRCRQVCSAWNAMILRNIWENPSKRKIIKIRIERNWGPEVLPSNEDISQVDISKGLAVD